MQWAIGLFFWSEPSATAIICNASSEGSKKDYLQAFRFMVGPDHCPMISKYGPSLSKAVGPVDPSFLIVKKSHFNKKYLSYSQSTNSTKQKVHVGSHTVKTV